MDTHLNFNSAYHPQTNRQTERINQILEDMLRACALHGGSMALLLLWLLTLQIPSFAIGRVGVNELEKKG
jgi:hypothetical protein